MWMPKIGLGIICALGLSAQQGEAAVISSLAVEGGTGCGIPVRLCYFGVPNSGSFEHAFGSGEHFMHYNASSDARGLFSDFSLFNFSSNSGALTLRSTDVFTITPIGLGGPAFVEVTARLRVSGRFGIEELGSGGSAFASARGIISATQPGVVGNIVVDGSNRDKSTGQINLLDPVFIIENPNVILWPELVLLVEVGRAFNLETTMETRLNYSGTSNNAIGGAAFSDSALISFDLPEGYFITSERGYIQGLQDAPEPDPGDVVAVPLPGTLPMLLTGLLLLGLRGRVR